MAQRIFDKNGVDDLVLLSTISEDTIVENLHARFRKDQIYTYIGPVLLSVNPFRNINGMYSMSMINQYKGRYMYELRPHVYAIGEAAYRALLSNRKNQCILVSGESGAGKTEASKKIMEYISAVSGTHAGAADHIKEQLLLSNPILEAFGNAKTVRNNNSSRFGKYMEIQFDWVGAPVGGKISNYLLEKPRVIGQSPDERNFHIFYQLMAGARSDMRRDLRLGSLQDYFYLNQSGCTTVAGMDDREEFGITTDAMDTVGISPQDKNSMLALVSAVAALGNLAFAPAAGQNGNAAATVIPASRPSLDIAAGLLRVDPAQLERALTHRTISTRGEDIEKPLDDTEAAYTRDALAKALYARNFQRLVVLINTAIAQSAASMAGSGGGAAAVAPPPMVGAGGAAADGGDGRTLGVLDIYGFEVLSVNSFEQLCINYCNERLQQLFIQLTLKAEQEEYASEGIAWTHIDFFNNKVVCDVIDSFRPPGILALLDEACVFPRSTDATWRTKMEQNLATHAHFAIDQQQEQMFCVRHYAGDVHYTIHGFLDKNKDALFTDLKDLGASSADAHIRSLFADAGASSGGGGGGRAAAGRGGGRGGGGGAKAKPKTAGWQFKTQMGKLIDTLMLCNPHYVRCLKPNDAKQSGQMDLDRVHHQVRYLGLLENVRVRRAGFAYRQTYIQFVRRYKMLCPATWPRGSGDGRTDTRAILAAAGVSAEQFEFGRSKVFIRDPLVLFSLEELRERRLPDIALLIQKCYRAWAARKYFLEMKERSLGIFGGQKRRRGSIHLYFVGDYLNIKDNFRVSTVIVKNGCSRVMFADHVQKINRKYKSQERVLMITNAAVYNLGPKKYNPLRRIPLTLVTGVSLSTFADGYLVIHVASEYDYVFISPRKAEIVTVLAAEYATATGGQQLPIAFTDLLEYKTKKRPCFLQFAEDAALTPPTATRCAAQPNNSAVLEVFVGPALGSGAAIQLSAGGASAGVRSAARAANTFASRAGAGAGPPPSAPPSRPAWRAETKSNGPPARPFR